VAAQDVVVLIICSLGAYLLLVAMTGVWAQLPPLAARLGRAVCDPFLFAAERADVRRRRRHIEDEVDRALGQTDAWGRRARAEVVQAAHDAQRIRMLDQMFRHTVTSCVRTHWAVAEGLGAMHMSEAARHPMCGHLRQRVIDLSELLSDAIERYPLVVDAPELVRLHVGLHRIAPTCIACPYWTTTIDTAPRLCAPARAVGGAGSASSEGEVNAQIVGEA
jgi:hypothetical protein